MEIDKKKAQTWYDSHKDHVDRLVQSATGAYPPTLAEDCRRPELWKAEHWNWFLNSPFSYIGHV